MLFTPEPFEDAIQSEGPEHSQTAGLHKAASVDNASPLLVRSLAFRSQEELEGQTWYHGIMSRREAEKLLQDDGDFLVRKSTTNPGSYVLTGMHNGLAKHLLLVDPEGTVRWSQRPGGREVGGVEQTKTEHSFSPQRSGRKITCSTAYCISSAITVTTIFQFCPLEVNCFSCSLSEGNSDARNG